MQVKKERIDEIFVIRTIACLAIVLLHTLTSSINNFPNADVAILNTMTGLSMLLLFGTPVFVFISEFLLAKSYSASIPKDFLRKRVKFLLIPYAVMGIVYAAVEMENFTLTGWIIHSLRNVFLADYTGYFVVIIFQFYILHKLFYKYLANKSAKKVLTGSLIINVVYLAFFNFVPPFDFIPYSEYLWYRLSFMPFIAWIFYFSLGYYSGKNYAAFKEFLKLNRTKLVFGTILSMSLVFLLKFSEIIPNVLSKRVDILLYTTCLLLLLFYLSSKIKRIPNVIFIISNYSFSIYLLHKIIIHYAESLISTNLMIYIPSIFSAALILSMIIAFLLNKIPYGKYIVGQIRDFKPRKHTEQEKPVQAV